MRVVVSKAVQQKVEAFYIAAMNQHPSLDKSVVDQKKDRLFDALESLGEFPYAFPKASVNRKWILAGYRDFVHEDFHFAYEIVRTSEGEVIVYVCDAIHSYLLHG